MFKNRYKPVVFAGSSISDLPDDKRSCLDIRPPAKRGDLDCLIADRKVGTVILIDGLFGSSLSITPTECRKLLQKGWCLIGASSMGALRANELWSVGMIGIGSVFMMFRLGMLRSDADVAVALHPNSFKELTASIVHIRSILYQMEKRKVLSGTFARKLLQSSRKFYWAERTWDDIICDWKKNGLSTTDAALAHKLISDTNYHPKKQDALVAVNSILAKRWMP